VECQWTLDDSFLTELNRWNLENKDSSRLSNILKKINNTIDVGKPFPDFISSSPFPTRKLVKALASLI